MENGDGALMCTINSKIAGEEVEGSNLSKSRHYQYDAVSASVIIWVPKLGESKSGQMVSEKVKWA